MASAMSVIVPQPSPAWPAWYYGPDDQAGIFQSADEVPPGWMSNPDAYRRANHEEVQAADEAADAPEEGQQEGLLTPKRRGRPPKVRDVPELPPSEEQF